MEEMTVVSFFVDRSGIAWDGKWICQVEQTLFEGEKGRLRYITVGLPFWDKTDTMWKAERQKEYLQHLPVPLQGRKVCYVCDRETEILYGLKPGVLSLEWGLFLLDFYRPTFDSLVVFEDREMDAQDLVLRFAPCLPYVGAVTAHPWRWEEVAEYIQEEYGYQIEVACTFTKLHPMGKRVLLWSGEQMRGLSPLTIPRDSIWLDTRCDRTFRQMLDKRQKSKIKTLNIHDFLHEFSGKSCIV
ncbi:MAG: hypothetical protein IJW63_02260 [Lachnospiraceae bacterium]|nr:hypothetical protein [Lachnospiraceae bacterium]